MLKENEIHFSGTVAQKALIFNKGKILLVQYPEDKVAHPNRMVWGKWDMPGGRLNEGEDVTEGIKREVREEVGLEIAIEKILTVGTFTNMIGKKVFFVIYKASLAHENQSIKIDNLEIGKAEWRNPEDFFELPVLYKEYQEALKTILL